MELLFDVMVQLLEKPIGEPLGSIEAKRNTDIDHIDDLEQQIEHSVVVNFPGKLCLQNIMRNTVKEVMNVHFQNILHILRISVYPFLYDFLRFMGAPFR